MKNKNILWRFGLTLAILCISITPHLAGAGVVPHIPTNPLDAVNGTPDYYTTANWANSPPLAKFVDTLPGLGSSKANNLGQYLPVAVPDIASYPGSDYYIIELREYSEKMHRDLNPTKLRGYVQVDAAGNDVAPIHYLGPIIVAERDRPVRIKFSNKLPTGSAGDLFIPVDTSVMGAGTGPATSGGTACNNTVEPNPCAFYTQNRANIHLHGGRTPWISDGTPHQWIVPADEITPFKKGVSLQNVPDMPDPGPGSTTYYFTNQQSARMMFYHDHAFGITRLNVYAGEAAGYLIKDPYEQDLVNRGLVPPDQIPLIIQDKTYVDATPTVHPVSGVTTPKIRITDPLWNWGSGIPDVNGVRPPETGDLWLPHVYMPAQTLAAGFGGVNPFGRWMYGPWFYPATAVEKGPVPNPYYDADCSSSNPLILAKCTTPGQPTMIPGTPNNSMGMEAFQDSVVVNGTAFPSLTVDPRAYRFRVLNAASDRFWNLSFYIADSDPAQLSPDPRLLAAGRSNKTEVKMLPASITTGWPVLWPVDGRDGGVPDPGFRGPSFLQIGNEGGFLPKPVVIEPQPITYNIDPTAFWVGTVDKMGLALGPAERADVIVDFSAYAGKTLILYNDAPAAWPARVAGYDYYTGAPDMRDSGGYGTDGTFDPPSGAWIGGTGPKAGYAPNTRTVMQVIVRGPGSVVDPAYSFNKANLEKEFTAAAPVVLGINPAPAKTLFERAQEPIIVGQAAYKDAYPNSFFPINFPWEGVAQINDQTLHFVTLAGEDVIAPAEPKGIHDEMGASFDPIYGRMSGNLAMQLPNPTTLNALLILYGFSDLPTETINNSTQLNVAVVPGTTNLADGTQIWKISHNGVDTHPIHFHIFDVQLVNRVGWDGQILHPEPNELGWKDTIKISPLMDTIVALRPRAPALPFGIPNSLRPLNPSIPLGSPMGFNSVDWQTGQARTPAVTNILYDFGWEYVWHCHILSHEEMDMMRPIVLKVDSTVPNEPTITAVSAGVVTWIDPTPITYAAYATYGNPANEIGFNVFRSIDGTNFSKLNTATLPANSTSFTDVLPVADALYKVEAFNAKGSTFSPTFRPLTVSVITAIGTILTAPAAINLVATVASLPAGVTVTKVSFYNGATLIGTDADAIAPYTFSWTNVPKGTYSVTARVTDSLGGVAVSTILNIPVTGSITANFTVTGSALGTDIGFCESLAFASTSTGIITGYSWSINGTNSITSTVNTTLPAGTYPVTLAVVNSTTGEVDQFTKNVVIVNHNPLAIPGGPYSVANGGNLTLNGSGTDPDPCNVTLSYAWNIDNKGNNDFFTAKPVISYNELNTVLGGGAHTITFQVTDSNGGITKATTTLTVEVSPPASILLPALSTNGSYAISWPASVTAGVTYILQESIDPTFASAVTETINAVSPVTIIGKANGTFYYRIKSIAADATSSIWVVGANGCTTAITLITAPIGGTFLAQGAPATVTAAAAPVGPAGSNVSKVDFFENGVLAGSDTTAPYTISWSPATLGARNLTAIAYYNDVSVSTSTSAMVTVTVLQVLPTVALDSPANGSSFAMGDAITLLATPAIISGATISGVEFYDALVLIKYVVTAPYTFSYIPTESGVRGLTARAYYSNGAVATSAAALVTVASASVVINNSAVLTNNHSVNLTISATGADKMSFSNNGSNYSPQENYATTKTWSLSPGDGLKTVYVRLYNATKGVSYNPIVAQITLDTITATTSITPGPGTFISPVNVIFYANEPVSTFTYTTDGSNPTTSTTATVYTGPISINADTTLKYFATDIAGNKEIVKSGFYKIYSGNLMTATVKINNGDLITIDRNVTIMLDAQNQAGVTSMQVSNDPANFPPFEPYPTTAPVTKQWTLTGGDGLKTVYVKFKDGVGIDYLYTSQITLVTKDGLLPGTTNQLQSALRAIQIANGLHTPDAVDLAHGDVAPYVNGKSVPDGRINALDAYVLLLKQVGIISGF